MISGNRFGVYVTRDADDNDVLNNLIGTDRFGATAVPNEFGILLYPAEFGAVDNEIRNNNRIGNGFLSGRNIVSGNLLEGISLWGNTDGTVIQNNFVGVASNGSTPLGNSQAGPDTGVVNGSGGFNWGGIVLRNGASNTTIGGLGDDGNIIANNNNGVVIFSGTGNRVEGNSIRDNVDRGIWLAGAEINDPGDGDEVANRGQNYPVVTSARIEGGNAIVDFSIDTADLGAYPMQIEIFEADSGASGEGARFLRRYEVTGPGSYTRNMGVAGGLSIVDGDPIVATATDAAGNTSSFSSVAVVGGGDALVGASAGDRLGSAVSIDGNRMAVSAPFADVGEANAGVVYVYDRADAVSPWVLTATIVSPEPELDGRFGDSLDLRGDLIAISESDRLGDEAEAGVVWAFSFNGFTWDPLGETLQQPVPTAGDRFGADVAWVDDVVLAIGAPGAVADRGTVFVATYNGSTWAFDDLLDPSLPPADQPLTGDEFGYSIAYDDSANGIGTLIVGAPGADATPGGDDGSIYRFQRSGATFNWISRLSGFNEDTAMGSSVEISGNRHVAGGYGTGSLEVGAYEFNGSWQEAGGKIFPAGGVPIALDDGPVNDYLAIDGRRIAVGRGGDGGSVQLFTIGDTWPAGPPTVIEPSGRDAGDRIGWSLDLEGGTLLAGSPGNDGVANAAADAGAVYSIDVPAVAGWTGASLVDGGLWSDPANWDTGVVPGAGDTAVVPEGSIVEVDVDTVVARLVVDSTATVTVRDGFRLGSGSTLIRANGIVSIQTGGELVLRNDAVIDGRIVVDETGALDRGLLTLDGPVAVSGAGRLTVFGRAQKTGPGTATVDVERILTYPTTVVSVGEGVLELAGFDLRDARSESQFIGLVGEAFVAAGAELRVAGDLELTDAATLAIGIDGDSMSTDNYGQITVTNTLFKNGALDAVFGAYVPTTADFYDVFDCGDCTPGAFATTDVEPLIVVINPTSITLAGDVGPVVPTFTGAVDSDWTNPGNWNTGVVPASGGQAVIPAGSQPVIAAGTDVVLSSLTIEGTPAIGDGGEVLGQLFVNGTLTLPTDSSLTIEQQGLLWAQVGGTVEIGGSVSFDGQIPVSGGTLRLVGGADLSGVGLIINNGTIETDGDVNVAPSVFWNSGTSSVLHVQSGTLTNTPNFQPFGVVRVAAGATASLAGNVILRPSSRLIIEVAENGTPGIIDVGNQLGFEPFEAGNQDQTLAAFELDARRRYGSGRPDHRDRVLRLCR